jgi:DNA-binding transcriptional ArsR family regulator
MKNRNKFEADIEFLSKLCKSIGHPARISILLFLKETGPSTCQDIVNKLPYSQSTVSGHLQKLKEDNYIHLKLHKTSSIYSIQLDTIKELQKSVQDVFGLKPEKKQLSLF